MSTHIIINIKYISSLLYLCQSVDKNLWCYPQVKFLCIYCDMYYLLLLWFWSLKRIRFKIIYSITSHNVSQVAELREQPRGKKQRKAFGGTAPPTQWPIVRTLREIINMDLQWKNAHICSAHLLAPARWRVQTLSFSEMQKYSRISIPFTFITSCRGPADRLLHISQPPTHSMGCCTFRNRNR